MVYLRLFHGRRRSEDGEIPSLDDWGLDGPVFGPFPSFHGTHSAEIAFGDGRALTLVDDFVFSDGVFYADWSVIDDATFHGSPDLRALRAPFVPALANPAG